MFKKIKKNNFTKNIQRFIITLATVSKKLNGGFTIVEMLVVIGIFSLLTTVVVFQYGKFNSQTIMTNMAYEVALATRQAQVFSLGVRGQSGISNFDNRYGVYFNLDNDRGERDFIFFIDEGAADNPEAADGFCNDAGQSGDCWACVSGDECLEKFSLSRDIFIDRICLSEKSEPISGDYGTCEGDEVLQATVTFQRPNPDAIVQDTDTGKSDYKSAAIILSNRFNNQRAVVIKNTGQISVEVLADK